jgi:hypothetical protein
VTAQSRLSSSATIGEEAVVANSLKALRENVYQEVPDELLGGQGHGFALVIVGVVLSRELTLWSSMSSKRSLSDKSRSRYTDTV